MIKRILVALDIDTDTPVAIQNAIQLAENCDASVSGLALVDTADIKAQVGGGGVGTIYYAQQLRFNMTEDAREKAGELLGMFEKMVREKNIRHSQLMEEGVPHERIIEDMKYHDLLVIGNESHFFYNRPDRDTKTLARLVKKSSSPVLVVNTLIGALNKVVVAHDGSVACSRALQWFVQLQPFGSDLSYDIVHVCNLNNKGEVDEGNLITHLASDYLKAHGCDNIHRELLEQGNTGKILSDYVDKSGAGLVVMGAHSMSAVRRMTFGSTTHEMVMNCSVPLFLSN